MMLDQGGTHKPRILIVEDEALLCEDLAQHLASWGYEVVGAAASGERAIEMVLATQPDLMLVDIKLRGDMDGIEAVRRVRTLRDVAVVYVTGLSQEDVLARARETEPSAYLTKPISPQELRATLDIVLYKQSMEKRLRTSEQNYLTLLETVPQGIVEIDTSGTIVFANPTLETLFGYGRHELPGKRILELVPSDMESHDLQQHVEHSVEQRPTPGPWFGRGLRKDGTVIELRVDWNYKRNDRGDVAGFISLVTDMTESFRSQQALRESEERYRTLFEKAGDAIFILEAEGPNAGCIVSANHAAAVMHGFEPEELVGLSVAQLDAPQDALLVPDRLARIARGEWIKEEVLHVRKDGTVFPVEISAGLLQLPNHKYVLAIDRDATDRRLAEQALNRLKETLEALLNVSPDFAILLDVEGKILALNLPAAEKFGKPAESLMGTPVFRWFRPEARNRRERAFRTVLETGRPLMQEETGRSGTIYETRLHPVLGLDRQIEGVAIFAQDITERRAVEHALLESERKYRSILETIADGYHEVDLQGNMTLVNDSLCEILGYSREELIGINYRQLMDKDNAHKIFLAYNHVFNTATPNPEFNYRIIRKDGTKRYASVSISLLRDSQGTAMGFHGIMRDVTDRKRLEDQLQQAAKMEAIGSLAGGVAHDFNNLLTAMIGHCDFLMREDALPKRSRQKLEVIYHAAERAARLTRQLLAFSRKQVLDVRIVDLNRLMANLETLLLSVVGEDLRLETRLDPSIGKVKVDQGQIEQIVINLVVNARDAMPNGGKLIIETSNATLDEDYTKNHPDLTPGSYVMFAVSDTGVGMDRSTLSRIFDPFFTTKPKGSGTGLGLATVYGIVKQHRGHITVYSEPGLGSTFKVYLPRSDEIVDARPPMSRPRRSAEGKEVVLIVEDEPVVSDLACEALELLGYTALKASNPDEALRICEQSQLAIDLVLSDVVLPQMDGRTLFGLLSQMRPTMKVIFMSGYTDNAIVHHGVLEKGVHFLQKPFSIQMLASKIREVLDAG